MHVEKEALEVWDLEVLMNGIIEQLLACPVDVEHLVVEDVVVHGPCEVAGMG